MAGDGRGNRYQGAVLGVAALCLALALAVSLLAFAATPPAKRPPLAQGLPRDIDGWRGQDVPLGDREVANAASRLLNYDDYIYRVYRRGNDEVWLYAMYWKQGSISVREIAGHTPDGCWIANGAALSAPKHTRRFQIDGQDTSPAEVREFAFPERQRVHALWWHIWGDNVVDHGFDQKSLKPTLRELWVWLAKRGGARRDQLLVRIHTPGNIDTMMTSEPVTAFLRNFPEIFEAKPLQP